ncbi:MAG TPA: NAD(P)/FAD-dependent oxidoreductase [Pyrinomonadaceae bacterium]|nr:NAD(P)/FAD-dependent oxidoreductase [Pyrinomonadaceae bacterium]
MEQFAVLIIGAGPAGSFAAELLAKAGVSVALFDGRPEGTPKACGGGVTAKALKAWPHLLNAVGRTVDELDMYSPSGKRLHLKLDEPFAIYSRIAFDCYLRDQAEAAGAKVFSTKVSARTIKRTESGWILRGPNRTAYGSQRLPDSTSAEALDHGTAYGSQRTPNSTSPDNDYDHTQPRSDSVEWQGQILVGADGAGSAIARMLAGPLPPSEMEVAFGYRAPLPESGSAPTVVAFLPKWVGYAWAFPRPDHISFGIATTQDAFEHEPLDKLLWDFMIGYYRQLENEKANLWTSHKADQDRDTRIKNKLTGTAERYAARIPGLNDTTWDNRQACGDGWALLGDAAGFADPVTGEGIYYALRSAELFAESFLKGDPLDYERRWREDFGAELRRASQMRRRFYGNFWGAPFTERMIEFARGHRGIKRVLGNLVAGEQGYTDLKKKLARSALKP